MADATFSIVRTSTNAESILLRAGDAYRQAGEHLAQLFIEI
jgi:hypothetical protein